MYQISLNKNNLKHQESVIYDFSHNESREAQDNFSPLFYEKKVLTILENCYLFTLISFGSAANEKKLLCEIAKLCLKNEM